MINEKDILCLKILTARKTLNRISWYRFRERRQKRHVVESLLMQLDGLLEKDSHANPNK